MQILKCRASDLRSFFRLVLISFLLPVIFFPSNLKAQALSCTGTDCPPVITNDLNDLGSLLQRDYGLQLARNFNRAHTLSNLGLIPQISEINVGLFTLGMQVNAGLGGTKAEIGSTDIGSSIEKPNFNGFFTQGMVYGALSLSVFSFLSDLFEPIDIYYANTNIKKLNLSPLSSSFDSLQYASNVTYFGFRYQIIDAIGAFFLEWQGLSLHVGRVSSKGRIIIQDEDEDEMERFRIANFDWKAENKVGLRSEGKSTIVELNTAFRVLLLNLSIGAGIAYNTIDSRVAFSRNGPLYLSGTQLNAILNIAFNSRHDTFVSRVDYLKGGVEFTLIPFTRIGLEYTYRDKENQSLSWGTRITL